MSSPVFVRDAHGTPLMPTSTAYARRLLKRGKARWVPHHAFPIIELSQVVSSPVLRPIVVGINIHLHTAELLVIADGERGPFQLLRIVVDLRTDLPTRIRRRAGHRRRRRARGRYRPMRHYGQPFKRRRPSMARSIWGRALRPRLRRARGSRPLSISPTMRWRAQAITRVIVALKKLMPLSHTLIFSPVNSSWSGHEGRSAATLRQQLIDTYGQVAADGQRRAVCAYCGTTEGRIELDHILPVARGGTDAWSNRALTCATCNARKGGQTPSEAGMSLQASISARPMQPNRAGVYARRTAQALVAQAHQHLPVTWLEPDGEQYTLLPKALYEALRSVITTEQPAAQIAARPIARMTKQIFSARNYPSSTPAKIGYVRTKQTIKRRIQVNAGLEITEQAGRKQIHVIPSGTVPRHVHGKAIAIGMLCEARRKGELITGIVAAIHSSGRLTFLVLDTVDKKNITWRRVIVSPRQHLRILSTERILFVRSSSSTFGGYDDTNGQ